MKEFRKGDLATLLPGTKLIYSVFLGFCLASYVVMGVMAVQRAGLTSSSLSRYYIGDPQQGVYGKTFGEMIEVTHFHLFSVPLFLFVQGHIFVLSSWRLKAKTLVVLAAFSGCLFYIAGPWLTVYVSPSLAFTVTGGRIAMVIACLIFTIVPLHEMWVPGPQSPRRKHSMRRGGA